MARQYKRKYELTLDDGSGLITVLSELRIIFEITKSLQSFPNLAMISIYNASPETLATIQNRFTRVVLNAGYEGNMRLVFKGDIRNVFQRRESEDAVTVIYAGDGEQDWQNGTFNKTLSENVTIKAVVEEISSTFIKVIKGELLGLGKPADKLRGQALSGSSKDILDQLGKDYGFDWSILDGALVTTPHEELSKPDELISISAATGMVGSPILTEIGADVKLLLNPEIQPNRGISIESVSSDIAIGNLNFRNLKKTSAEGVYKVYEVVHKGDTHSNEWSSNVKGITLHV